MLSMHLRLGGEAQAVGAAGNAGRERGPCCASPFFAPRGQRCLRGWETPAGGVQAEAGGLRSADRRGCCDREVEAAIKTVAGPIEPKGTVQIRSRCKTSGGLHQTGAAGTPLGAEAGALSLALGVPAGVFGLAFGSGAGALGNLLGGPLRFFGGVLDVHPNPVAVNMTQPFLQVDVQSGHRFGYPCFNHRAEVSQAVQETEVNLNVVRAFI